MSNSETSEEKLKRISYLTLGGWDERDYIGNISWYDTSQSGSSWNLTSNQFSIDDVDLIPLTHNASMPNSQATVMFQVGYPYIGV